MHCGIALSAMDIEQFFQNEAFYSVICRLQIESHSSDAYKCCLGRFTVVHWQNCGSDRLSIIMFPNGLFHSLLSMRHMFETALVRIIDLASSSSLCLLCATHHYDTCLVVMDSPDSYQLGVGFNWRSRQDVWMPGISLSRALLSFVFTLQNVSTTWTASVESANNWGVKVKSQTQSSKLL